MGQPRAWQLKNHRKELISVMCVHYSHQSNNTGIMSSPAQSSLRFIVVRPKDVINNMNSLIIFISDKHIIKEGSHLISSHVLVTRARLIECQISNQPKYKFIKRWNHSVPSDALFLCLASRPQRLLPPCWRGGVKDTGTTHSSAGVLDTRQQQQPATAVTR